MTIQWSKRAARELAAAHAYVAEDNPGAADRLMADILDSVLHLKVHPLAGRDGRVRKTRELAIPGTPYIVAYRLKGADTLQVVGVIHGKRRWPMTF